MYHFLFTFMCSYVSLCVLCVQCTMDRWSFFFDSNSPLTRTRVQLQWSACCSLGLWNLLAITDISYIIFNVATTMMPICTNHKFINYRNLNINVPSVKNNFRISSITIFVDKSVSQPMIRGPQAVCEEVQSGPWNF